MMKDLRDFLEALSGNEKEYLVSGASVSPDKEITRIVYFLQHRNENPAIRFDKVDGSSMPLVTNLLGSRGRLALALGCEEADLDRTYRTREKNRILPILVGSGSIQEVEVNGAEIDITRLPVVTHNQGDAGPYITAGMMTVKDPDTGIRNTGIYRLMVKDGRHTGIHLAETGHAYMIFRKYIERKQDMPVAITIGAHPALYLGSLSLAPFGVDEFEVMGGLLSQPLELVKCRTVDLEVPANGEICLEGHISWNLRETEGPVGEWQSVYSQQHSYPVLTIDHMSTRKDPIYMDVCSGAAEHLLMGGLPKLSRIFESVRQGCSGVKDVYMPLGGFCRNLCYVSMKKNLEGEPATAAAAVFAADFFVRHVVVVDEDVDIHSDTEVLQALHLNMVPGRCFIMPYAKGDPTDPTSREGVVAKIGIDATRPVGKKLDRINWKEGFDQVDLGKIFPEKECGRMT
ncbi:MAG: UbiD family decarboxylase [Spirochaetae bacterium HGW-Spirochaetae-9]|nr:MAG: UbiD family decarboxylase [Spirochaetae bacterium HGW-Spirochaetae-9]